jgi:ABC-2 type transport system permease protein
MTMNIYKHEFKMNLRSVITWSISIALLLFVFLSLYSSFAADAELLNETMAQMPPELLTAFGMTGLDLATILGFYSLAFLFCQICLAIQAANYGFGLVSVEERDMTADFLLAKPVGRAHILTNKLLAALTGLTITNIVVWISSFVFINMFSAGRPYETNTLLLLLISIIPFQLFFLTVGIVISLLMKRVRSVTSAAMALAFGMYVLSAFGGMLGGDTFDVITPFKHFEPNYIISNGSYDVPRVLLSLAVILISVVGSYLLYQRRNIQTAQ